MRRPILTACILALPLAGCTRNAATFYEEYVRLSCRFGKKCLKALFNDSYDDMADCKDEQTDRCSPDDFEDACADYDKDEAKECLDQTREQIRKCEIDENDDSCDWSKICGDAPETYQDVQACLYGNEDGFGGDGNTDGGFASSGGGGDGDGSDGASGDGATATGVEAAPVDQISQAP